MRKILAIFKRSRNPTARQALAVLDGKEVKA